MAKPHRCIDCGGEEPDVRFHRRDSGNLRPYCNACKSIRGTTRLYGITPADYYALLQKQDGKCAICKTPAVDIEHARFKRLVVDHDHATGIVRGLLCAKCNLALGHFNDSPRLLAAAIHYLT